MSREDAHYMRLAIEEAKKAQGQTYPNPVVGAVIVEEGEVVASGYHAKAGEAHAEINAIKALQRNAKEGAVLFVTLEPCSTTGKTPPCTQAIIDSGIKHVVIGAIDPNPEHRGRGITILKEAGVKVEAGVLAEECQALNQDFNERMNENKR